MSGKKRFLLAAVTAGLMAGAAGLAQAQSNDSFIEEVNEYRAKAQLIRAKIEEARARADLAALELEVMGGGAVDGVPEASASQAPASASASQPEQAAPVPVPEVIAIFGSDNALYASLRFASGLRQDVQKGDRIDGGYTVQSVSASKVVLTQKGKSITLRTYGGSNI